MVVEIFWTSFFIEHSVHSSVTVIELLFENFKILLVTIDVTHNIIYHIGVVQLQNLFEQVSVVFLCFLYDSIQDLSELHLAVFFKNRLIVKDSCSNASLFIFYFV